MFRNATARRIARAQRPTVTVTRDEQHDTIVRPAKRPARRTVRTAAINASLLDLPVR